MNLKIIGLDPGTLNMGWGVLSVTEDSVEVLDFGCLIFSKKEAVGKRLLPMEKSLSLLFKKHRPRQTAIEKVFLGKNPDSAFKLGQAFAMGLYVSERFSSSVFEYSTRKIKKSLTGHGSASKDSVRFFVENGLGLKQKIKFQDSSDALAAALCHAYYLQSHNILKGP